MTTLIFVPLIVNHMESKVIEISSDKKMHYLIEGGGERLFLLIHGGDRNFQNAAYWKPLITKLASNGKVIAVDLFGHGKSIPGPTAAGRVSLHDQLNGLQQVLVEEGFKKGENSDNVIVIGRSFGGGVALSFADHYPEYVDGLVLIAPAVSSSQLERFNEHVRKLPVLIFWAEDDPIIPYSNYSFVAEFFENRMFVSVGAILEKGMERWQGHTPEMVKQEKFINALNEYVRKYFTD